MRALFVVLLVVGFVATFWWWIAAASDHTGFTSQTFSTIAPRSRCYCRAKGFGVSGPSGYRRPPRIVQQHPLGCASA
jgi:hypothetical protein